MALDTFPNKDVARRIILHSLAKAVLKSFWMRVEEVDPSRHSATTGRERPIAGRRSRAGIPLCALNVWRCIHCGFERCVTARCAFNRGGHRTTCPVTRAAKVLGLDVEDL